MILFGYEWKRYRKYILGWAVAVALCIFGMTPLYYSMMDGASSGTLYQTLGDSDFYRSVGLSSQYLTSSLGIYAFLTSFFLIASGVFGLHFGLSIHTREYSEKTAEYLFTKPCSRWEIFIAKTLTVCCGVLLVSAAYLAASALALLLFRPHIPWGEFALVVGSFPLLTLFFAALGLLLGTLWPNNRSPLLTAGMLIFVEYCITSFSRVASLPAISYLSPYSYFNAAEMAQLGCYSGSYLLCYGILLLTFLLLAYRIFLRRNIPLH